MKLRFTIRDLLWLVALLALAVGWWIDHGLQSNWRRGTEFQAEFVSTMYTHQSEFLGRLKQDHPDLFIESSGPFTGEMAFPAEVAK